MKKSIYPTSALAILGVPFMFAVSVRADYVSNSTLHSPCDGDNLHPNVCVSGRGVSNVDHADRMVFFNPDLFVPMDDADISIHQNNDTLSYIQFATRHLFLSRGDTLSYLGHENRYSEFKFDRPVEVMPMRLPAGKGDERGWNGRFCLHGRDFLKRAAGLSKTCIDSGWTLTDGTDTIHNATYAMWDMDMAYFDTGILEAADADTIPTDSISDLELPVLELAAERLLTRREMWFSEDARYPVLQRSRVFRLRADEDSACDTIPVSAFAMHYPASFQYSDTGVEPTRNKPSGDSHDAGGRKWMPEDGIGKLKVSEPTTDGRFIHVTVSSEEGDTEVSLTLYTDSGIRMSDTMTVTAGAIPRTCTLPVPANASGVIILLTETGTGSTTQKIIL